MFRELLIQIAHQQRVEPIQWRDWEQLNVPQQDGGSDCGVFSIYFAHYYAQWWKNGCIENLMFNFQSSMIPFLRRKLCYDFVGHLISNGSFKFFMYCNYFDS